MGDRAQVCIRQYSPEDSPVYLYTHWSGAALARKVHEALSIGERWDDACYLARIVFNAIQGEDRSTTGFGIDTAEHGDIEHPLIIIHTRTGEIEIASQRWMLGSFVQDPAPAYAAYAGDPVSNS